jgi:hypothetical protein
MLSSFWVASTKPGAALVRGQGWTPWQGRGWFLAPRDRGPEAGVYCVEGHYYSLTRTLARGSSASRTPSPSTFSARTVSTIMIPGAIATSGRT